MPVKDDFKFENGIPENLGLSSEKVLEFIKFVSGKCPLLRAFVLIKDKKIAAEGYFKPFDYKTKLCGCTLREAARKIILGYQAEGFESVETKDKKTIFVLAAGERVSKKLKSCIYQETERLNGGKETVDCRDIEGFEKLLLYLSALKAPISGKGLQEESESLVGGKTYSVLPNDLKIEWIRLSWGDKIGALRLKDAKGEHELYFGRGEYRAFSFPHVPADGYAAGAWDGKNRFVIVIGFIGVRAGGMKAIFDFEGSKLIITAQNTVRGTNYILEGAETK